MAKGKNSYSERLARQVAAARVNSKESEKLYLQNLVSELAPKLRAITDRIRALDREIDAEKNSFNL
jgi:hypothetical protein